MAKLMTLGTNLSYSDLASKQFIKQLNLDVTIYFEPSIDSAFHALKNAKYLVLPIENAIDGYIQRTLDLLYKHNFYITHVLELPVDFSLVSDETDRKSTRLNSSHVRISYAVFCLKKKNNYSSN